MNFNDAFYRGLTKLTLKELSRKKREKMMAI